METTREAARIAIENTIARLKEIVPGVPLDAPITLDAITPYPQTMQTTFGREVAHRHFHTFSFYDCLTLFPFPAVVCWFTCCPSLVYGMNVLHLLSSQSGTAHLPRPADPRNRRRTGSSALCPLAMSFILSSREFDSMDHLDSHRQHWSTNVAKPA
jgi:hypothetical protein